MFARAAFNHDELFRYLKDSRWIKKVDSLGESPTNGVGEFIGKFIVKFFVCEIHKYSKKLYDLKKMNRMIRIVGINKNPENY